MILDLMQKEKSHTQLFKEALIWIKVPGDGSSVPLRVFEAVKLETHHRMDSVRQLGCRAQPLCST
jgi:hypothetical protein